MSSYRLADRYPVSYNRSVREPGISYESSVYLFSDHPLDEALGNYCTSYWVNRNLGFNDDFGRQTFVAIPGPWDFTDAYTWDCEDTHKVVLPFHHLCKPIDIRPISSYRRLKYTATGVRYIEE